MKVPMDLHQESLFLLALNSVVMSLEDDLIDSVKGTFPYLNCDTKIRCTRAALVTIRLKVFISNKYILSPSGVT